MRLILLLLLMVQLSLLTSCIIDMPGDPDGKVSMSVAVVDTSGFIPGIMDSTEVRLKSRTHEFSAITFTDSTGTASFNKLVAGWYDVFARREALLGSSKKTFIGGFDFHLTGDELFETTVYTHLIASSDLVINEIYYCGADYATYYFYDQYVELHNAADTTMYLDGIILTRQTQTRYPDLDEVDYVRATYAFQFPGTPVTGRDYPIQPGEFIVVAADAIDHRVYCAKSIDLSGADWECFNPLGSDYDNPSVPNIVSIHPTKGVDYLINLSHNAIVIATGEEYSFFEYEPGKLHILLPIYTVIDGVEYAFNDSYQKELTVRVDAGFGGGCVKYSGQSTERLELGLDTNDSSFDFTVVPNPTPGYSHAQ
jgi:hypothetical protein